jgi:hypothetical protein
MRWRIWQTAIAPRLACWPCLPFGLLVLAVGCARQPHSVEHVEVSGKVLFQDKPLPGGRVTFVATNGGFASTGKIDENGNYRLNAPVGPVQISVDNRILQPEAQKQAKRLGKSKSKTGAKDPVKGVFVPIPPKYYDPGTSQLTYEVKPGPQTHDIVLDNDR